MSRSKRANPATIIAILALCVAVVGTAAAGPIAEISLTKQEKKQTRKIAAKLARKIAARVSNKRITKRAPKLSVANAGSATNANAANVANSANTASVANTANSLAPSEAWHQVGAPGEPGFENSWENTSVTELEPAGFFKDHEGIVHLKGVIVGGTEPQVFRLPPGYRPASGRYLEASTFCTGPSCSSFSGPLVIGGSNVVPGQDGAVRVPQESVVSLDTITFRAES